MLSGNFSRSVIVREWSSRHCFISIPRPWASLTLPAPTPTFTLDLSEERSLLLSWAGDMHNPNPGDENAILISREVLRRSGIVDGELGIITQVAVPPPCTSITVHAGSLADWQDLALNAEVAQSAFLSQVRVLSLGQSLPLWLEGGVHITLTVSHIDPPNKFGVLHTLTQVEVLPPIEHEESDEFYPISYIPSEAECTEEGKSEEELLNSSRANWLQSSNGKPDGNEQKHFDHPFESLLKYMSFRLQQAKVTSEFSLKKDFTYGYRVLSASFSSDSQMKELVTNHPSLVVISSQSLAYVEHQNKISFIAKVRKIDSPVEKAEKVANIRDEERAENKQKGISVAHIEACMSSDVLCTVIVWENFIDIKDESSNLDMNTLAKGNSCIVSDCLRRMLKLESLSTIELSSIDVTFKTVPVALDFSPVSSDIEVSISVIQNSLKELFKDLVDVSCVVVNAVTLVSVKVENKMFDVFITIRDGSPLKLSKESVVLLQMTRVADPSNIPHIPSSIADVDIKFTPKFQYLGSEKVHSDLQQHILVGVGYLLRQYKGIPQFALLHGSKGSGKTSLLETIAQNLSSFPYFFHFQFVSLKQLKGKKMETVEKKLQLVFREAVFRRPSVIVLDDLDSLVPSKGLEDQNFGPLYDHTMQMLNMLKSLLDDLLQFCHEDRGLFPGDNLKKGSVMVVATSLWRNSVHPLLVNPQGCHYFPCSFGIPPLEPEERMKALNIMLQDYHQKCRSQRLIVPHDCVASNAQVEEISDESLGMINSIGAIQAMKLTENFVLPDISHLALRIYLHAQHRWKKCVKQMKCCVRCGNIIGKSVQSTINSKLNLALADNTDHKEDLLITDEDLKAAREGYVPLALRGLELSSNETGTSVMKVGGLAEAYKTLKEMLMWPSTYPNLFSKIKLRLRSGVLLFGPPGCGKTLIANSIAKNCQLNFISVKGPELLSKYIGASEQAVRDAFERASSAKPCVLFFDEFESIAPRRGHDSTGVTDRVVNQLLTQMDGVEGLSGVYILAATSRPDLIDPALLRPGRLDKCVFCPMPTLSDREEILRILSEDVELGEEIDWADFARDTENYTGADLQSLLATAQILVAQEALGEALYKGVIQPDRKPDHERNGLTYFCDENSDQKTQGPSLEKDVLQVVIEKEKCKYIPDNVQDNYANMKETESKNSLCSSHNCEGLVDEESEQSETQIFKVYKRHLEIALKEVKPSVTVAERKKYEQLYSSFHKSREGNFGKQSPGKRATLA
ncbi:peroxisomal ATPase PEX1 [Palaemon carinicauda]|uniref:peroxisomal ATPase PEX1 n=1 Tax=Palaemon carinicauda TaxID=392227 RepID=UPI0035B580CB